MDVNDNAVYVEKSSMFSFQSKDSAVSYTFSQNIAVSLIKMFLRHLSIHKLIELVRDFPTGQVCAHSFIFRYPPWLIAWALGVLLGVFSENLIRRVISFLVNYVFDW